MYFAAVELRSGEDPEEAIRYFLTVAADLGIKFKRAKTYGLIEIASVRLVRFQTDCPTFPPIVARLRNTKRSVVIPTTAGYRAFLANGREGPVKFAVMQELARPGYSKVYLGPGHEHWKAQFTPGASPAKVEDLDGQ